MLKLNLIKYSLYGTFTYYILNKIYESGSKNIHKSIIKWGGFENVPTYQVFMKNELGEAPELKRVWVIENEENKYSNEGQRPDV